MTDLTPFESAAPPSRTLRSVGTGLLLLVSGVALGVLAKEGPTVGRATAVGTGIALAAGLAAWLGRTPARLRIDERGIEVGYTPWRRTVPWSDVEEVVAGDHVDGIGWGYGWRWEGRGRVAVRVGGPMVTVVHRTGRLGVSVPDPDAALEAVRVRRSRAG